MREGEERVVVELLVAEEDHQVLEPDRAQLGDGGVVEAREVDAGDDRADRTRERLDVQARRGGCAHGTLMGTDL